MMVRASKICDLVCIKCRFSYFIAAGCDGWPWIGTGDGGWLVARELTDGKKIPKSERIDVLHPEEAIEDCGRYLC